ncbi:unnamed protein product [marine sediment metagenome]|uniref:Cupin type-1 domain-containing protein n=1 Tax=marine sediment metagenome TaxID=412755 RepID=X1MLD9_9ZZZZ
MAKSKYSKYFLNELPPEERQKGFGRMPAMVAFTDDDIIKGSHYLSVMVMGEAATKSAGHGPHTHNDPEVLVALGTDPDNPKVLGAEIELCMGPEMESHIITESTLVYIPANFIHCPFRILKVDRPFLFIQAQYAPKLTETSLKKLVAEELRDKMIFIEADGTQKD